MPIIPRGKNILGGNEFRIQFGALVDYEQNGKEYLGLALRERKSNWLVLNLEGKEIELAAGRLFLFPGLEYSGNLQESDPRSMTSYLAQILRQTETLENEISLEEIWEVLEESPREYSLFEIADLVGGSNNPLVALALRRILLANPIYFKRKKTGFEPRSRQTVVELKRQAAIEAEKKEELDRFRVAIKQRIAGQDVPLPATVELLEDYAALGGKFPRHKEAQSLLYEIEESLDLKLRGKGEEKAFELLVRARHFSIDQNLSLYRLGRRPGFSKELQILAENTAEALCFEPKEGCRDLRDLKLITIDAEDTEDIDDALSIERIPEGYRVGIHISDVAQVVSPKSLLDEEAKARATSLYFPDGKESMFPPILSEDVLSLVEGKERYAMSFFIDVSRGGDIINRSVNMSLVRVYRRLSYAEVDDLLNGSATSEDTFLPQMLLELWEVASSCEAQRLKKGALQISRREVFPVVGTNGVVRLEEWDEETPARKMVSELMVLANVTGAMLARDNGLALAYRSQQGLDTASDLLEHPERMEKIAEGPARDYAQRGLLKPSIVSTDALPHFGLAVPVYAQMTSPIRRYTDLLNQRQLKNFLIRQQAEFSKQDVDEVIMLADNSLTEARLVQRERTRYWLYKYLIQEKIRQLEGTVVRIDGTKPLVELDLFATTFIFRSHRHTPGGGGSLKVGDRVVVRVERIDPRQDDLVLQEC